MTHTEQLRLWELASRLGWTEGVSLPSHLTDPSRTGLDTGAEPYHPIRAPMSVNPTQEGR